MVTMLKRMGGSLLAGWSEWPKGGWIVKAAKITNPGMEGRGEELYHASTTEEALKVAYDMPREWPYVSVWPGEGWRGEGQELPPMRCTDPQLRKHQQLIIVRTIKDGEGAHGQRCFAKAHPGEVGMIMQLVGQALGIPTA